MWNYPRKVRRFSLVLLLLTLQAEVRQLGACCVSLRGERGTLEGPGGDPMSVLLREKEESLGFWKRGGLNSDLIGINWLDI